MPLFDYRCSHCGNRATDHLVPRASVDITLACKCGWEMEREISRTSFRLNGGGWAAGGYVKETHTHLDGIRTTVEGDTRVLSNR